MACAIRSEGGIIRNLTMHAVRQILDGDVAAFRKALDSVCRERRFLAFLEAPSLKDVRTFIKRNVQAGHPQFVAEIDGSIVGWCDAIPGEAGSGTAHVGRLGMGVIKEHRRHGLGQELLDATLREAQRVGLEKIELSVYASNAAAIALYRKNGFREEGRQLRGRLVDGIYDDVVLMAITMGKD